MKYTIKHYFDFGEKNEVINSNLLSKESWDAIRVENCETPFSIPKGRAEWISKCSSPKLSIIAKEIIDIMKKNNLTSVTSVGVGIAALEYNIKNYCSTIYI